MSRWRQSGKRPTPRGPSADEVVTLYRELLRRDPLEAEVAHQLEHASSATALVQVLTNSQEYEGRHSAPATPVPPATVVNVYDERLARWSHPVGTMSADGDAIVGHDGWLFLCGGSNANLGQYRGEVAMDEGWLEQWKALDARRRAEATGVGAAIATLIVPDKLAVYEEHYPQALGKAGPRPVERLLGEGGVDIAYPLAQLRAAASGEPVYLRTDSHLTLRGNAVLYDCVREQLGAPVGDVLDGLSTGENLISGDLGARFSPPVVEVSTITGHLGAAGITADNRAEVAAVGGHIGTLRVYANPQAPDPRTVVVFGDSFGFGDAGYQGVAWFLAQAFREVHFVWVPFGWDLGYVRRVGATAVVFQAAERFVARVPLETVDAENLARETLARKAALGLDTAFGG